MIFFKECLCLVSQITYKAATGFPDVSHHHWSRTPEHKNLGIYFVVRYFTSVSKIILYRIYSKILVSMIHLFHKCCAWHLKIWSTPRDIQLMYKLSWCLSSCITTASDSAVSLQSVGQWYVMFSDFGDSFRIYRACLFLWNLSKSSVFLHFKWPNS